MHSGEFRPESPVKAAGWGLDGQDLNRFIEDTNVPSQAGIPNPSPAGLQALQIMEARLRRPLLSVYLQRKAEALKGPFLNFYQTLPAMPVPQALIH